MTERWDEVMTIEALFELLQTHYSYFIHSKVDQSARPNALRFKVTPTCVVLPNQEDLG